MTLTVSDSVFFTADIHFGHKLMVSSGLRKGFSCVEEMDAKLVENWNSVVPKHGMVFFLGDLSFSKLDRTAELLEQLNGEILWVPGNHDKRMLGRVLAIGAGWVTKLDSIFEIDVLDSTLEAKKQRITLCHYPMMVWNRAGYGSWMLHGHSHASLVDTSMSLRIDVGVDAQNLTPVSYHQLKSQMRGRCYVPVDHHKVIVSK